MEEPFSNTMPALTATLPLLAQLKATTMPHHKRLESKVDWFKPGFSRADYTQLLSRFWSYYYPLELKFSQIPELKSWLPDYGQRAKSPLLLIDLQNLGVAIDSLMQGPLCTVQPNLSQPAAALGCLYVIEGSTLGGQLLSRHFMQTLDLEKNNGAAFFTGYGESTLAMWENFRAALNAAQVDQETVIEAASETFITLERWLCPSN